MHKQIIQKEVLQPGYGNATVIHNFKMSVYRRQVLTFQMEVHLVVNGYKITQHQKEFFIVFHFLLL